MEAVQIKALDGKQQMRVRWTHPITPNGVISYYTVIWTVGSVEKQTILDKTTLIYTISELPACTSVRVLVYASSGCCSGANSTTNSELTYVNGIKLQVDIIWFYCSEVDTMYEYILYCTST